MERTVFLPPHHLTPYVGRCPVDHLPVHTVRCTGRSDTYRGENESTEGVVT